MTKSLKEKTISGMLWSSVHRFGTMGISFITNLILARLLTPEDFGLIGMIIVFIAISETFVDGGFASALIQKKNPTNEDYSTIFYWNLFISFLLYILLYFSSPLVERFYEMESLALILQVLGLILIINAFNIIQFNLLHKQINFKKIGYIYIAANVLGGGIGIFLAFSGYGVWSLVAKMIADTIFQTIFLWFTSKWKPSWIFSINSFKKLFGYGSFILITSLINRVYENAQALIIGKLFSAGDLGLYTQARKMEEVPVKGLSSVVNQVTFPVFSELQNDIDRLLTGIKKSVKGITFINFPLMMILVVGAEPIIIFLLTDKWAEAIPFMQILCFSGMLYSLNTANTNIFKSLGRSDIYFWATLVKRIIGIITILIGAKFGIIGMLYVIAINTYLFFFINAFLSSKLTGYTVVDQITDVFPAYILSIIIGIITHILLINITVNNLIHISAIITIYLTLYLSISYILRYDSMSIYLELIKNRIG